MIEKVEDRRKYKNRSDEVCKKLYRKLNSELKRKKAKSVTEMDYNLMFREECSK